MLPPASAVMNNCFASGYARLPILFHHCRIEASSELGRVVVTAHAHPRFVPRHVVDAVRDGLTDRVAGKIVNQRLLGRASRLPLRPAFLKSPTNSFFLGVDGDYRLLPPQERRSGRVDARTVHCGRDATHPRGSYAPTASCSPVRGADGRTVVELTRHPSFESVDASFARLLHVHRSGDMGSPRVSGSTNCSSAAFTPGSSSRYRVVLLRRGAPGSWLRLHSTSRRPLRIVTRPMPVAAETTESPRSRWTSIQLRPTDDVHAVENWGDDGELRHDGASNLVSLHSRRRSHPLAVG